MNAPCLSSAFDAAGALASTVGLYENTGGLHGYIRGLTDSVSCDTASLVKPPETPQVIELISRVIPEEYHENRRMAIIGAYLRGEISLCLEEQRKISSKSNLDIRDFLECETKLKEVNESHIEDLLGEFENDGYKIQEEAMILYDRKCKENGVTFRLRRKVVGDKEELFFTLKGSSGIRRFREQDGIKVKPELNFQLVSTTSLDKMFRSANEKTKTRKKWILTRGSETIVIVLDSSGKNLVVEVEGKLAILQEFLETYFPRVKLSSAGSEALHAVGEAA